MDSPHESPAPPALYRSAFADECAAIVQELRRRAAATEAGPGPEWSALTVEGESLTPLESAGAASFAALQARPGPGQTPAGEEPAGPPPRQDRTYDGAALDATFLCGSASCSSGHRTYEHELPAGEEAPPAAPLLTSTPLLPVPAGRLPPALLRGGGQDRRESLRGLGQKRRRILTTHKKEQGVPPSSKSTRQSVGEKPPVSLRLDQCSVYGENKHPGTRLPVPAGLAKKPRGGVLLAPGQVPRSAQGSASRGACAQCQRLREENKRLKGLLEDCWRTIAGLKEKKKEDNEDLVTANFKLSEKAP